VDYEERLAAIEAAGVDTAKLRRGLEGDDTKHLSTRYEIDIVHLFVAAGFTDIVIEPPVPNSGKVADLLVHAGGEDIYVEVEGWDRWSHHHHMSETAASVEALMNEQGYPAADIQVKDVRVHPSTIVAALPKVSDVHFGIPIVTDAFEVTFVPPEEDRHGIHSASYARDVQNTRVINQAYPHVQAGEGGLPSYTDVLRERISEGYEQVKTASPEHATLVVVRASMGGETVAEAFDDALRGDRVHIVDGIEDAATGTGHISLRAVRPLDESEPPDGFQPMGLFNVDGYERLSAAIVYCPPNFMGEQAVFVGIGHPKAARVLPEGVGEALCEAAKAERQGTATDEPGSS